MKVATTLLIGALAAKQAVATWDLFAPPFSVPQLCENICDDNDKNGFDWSDLIDGKDVGDYKGYQFPGFKCSNRFNKRDDLTKRTFQSKCITGKVSKDKISGPKIGSNKKNFSINEMQISVDADIDVEFHYGMPDGSTCKQNVPCKKGGSKIKNTMCGGAKEVTFQIPKGGKKDNCELNFHNIDFYCNPKPPPSTPKPSSTPTPTPTPSKPVCQPGDNSPGCPETPSPTPTPPTETPCTPGDEGCPPETPCTPGDEGCPPETPCTPGEEGCPPESTPPTPEPPVSSPPVSTSVPLPSPPSTPSSPPSDNPSSPPSPPSTPGAPPPNETPVSPPGGDYESSTAVLPNPSSSPTPPPAGSTPPTPEQPGSTVIASEPSTIVTPVVPVPTADCPSEVQKCINTANEIKNKCKDNTDSDCYCKDPELVKDVMECLDQWLTDDIKNDAFGFFIGICAPHIPENPGIVTNCPPSITLGPTPPPAAPTGEAPPSSVNGPITAAPSLPAGGAPPQTTITATQTVTVPCDCESPSMSTYTTTITVPQVHFTTPPAGQTAGESVGLVPGTPLPVEGNPTATGVLPTGFGTSVISTPTRTAGATPSAFTGAASNFGANTVGAIAGAFIAVLAL